MTHARNGAATRAKRKKILKMAKGFRGRSKNCIRVAKQSVEKSLQYAYRDRRNRKRDFRALWIQRINAGARLHGLTYSQLIHGLKLAGVELDRKSLSELAAREPEAFATVANQAQDALKKAA